MSSGNFKFACLSGCLLYNKPCICMKIMNAKGSRIIAYFVDRSLVVKWLTHYLNQLAPAGRR